MIAKSGMDGSNVIEFVTQGLYWPNGVATDTPNGRLYWTEAKHKLIESIKFDGSDRRVRNNYPIGKNDMSNGKNTPLQCRYKVFWSRGRTF